jgi:hypothetical protein
MIIHATDDILETHTSSVLSAAGTLGQVGATHVCGSFEWASDDRAT